ncbi:MAG: ABC transporter permease subunit, partial [Aeromonas sp.]
AWSVATLTTLIRGLPELLVVLFIYFGSTQVLFLITGEYVEFSPFACGVLALSLLFASYATQTLRAALNAVPVGQRLAAMALGLSKGQIFFRIVLPQAWRHALPGLGNQWLVLLKDTALVSLIGVNEIMRQAQMASASTYEPFTWYASAALIYLAISLVSEFGLSLAARYTRRYGG